MQDNSEHKLYTRFKGYLNADFQFHRNYMMLSNTSYQSNERDISEQVLNWFSSIQFLQDDMLGMLAYSGAAFVSLTYLTQ